MALPEYPQSEADYLAGLTNEDMINGGHRTHFIAALQAMLELTGYTKDAAGELLSLAEQVAEDAASAAAGSGTEVTKEQIWAGAAAQYLSIRRVYEANAPVSLTDASSIAVDLSAGINFTVTLAGNRTLANPTNATAGKSGIIIVNQDATGGRTLAKGSNWKVAGGEISLDLSSNAKNVLAYYVESSTSILLTVSEAFS